MSCGNSSEPAGGAGAASPGSCVLPPETLRKAQISPAGLSTVWTLR